MKYLRCCEISHYRKSRDEKKEFMAGAWGPNLVLVAEIATARNRMRKSTSFKQI